MATRTLRKRKSLQTSNDEAAIDAAGPQLDTTNESPKKKSKVVQRTEDENCENDNAVLSQGAAEPRPTEGMLC
jgi:hypothetical protein